jgi:hypothetical protein
MYQVKTPIMKKILSPISFKYFIISFLFFILCGCENFNKNKIAVDFADDLKLELLNEEVYYLNFDSIYNNELKATYNDGQREKSINRIDFRITNLSKKNYVLFLDYNSIQEFGGYYKPDSKSDLNLVYSKLNFLIESESDNFVNKDSNGFNYNDCQIKNIEQKSKCLFEKYGQSKFQLYNENLIVLHPNETRTFRSVISLPILVDDENSLLGEYKTFFLNSKLGYKFRLAISQDKNVLLNQLLEKSQIQEIATNNQEVFDGILISNAVSLKCKE